MRVTDFHLPGTAVAALLALVFPIAHIPAWAGSVTIDETVEVAPGVVANRMTIVTATSRTRALSIDVDTQRVGLYVLTNRNPDRFGEAGKASGSATGYSIREFASSPGVVAALSGTYLSSFSPPLPLGYVRSDGTRYNSAHLSWLTNGMICMTDGVPKLLASATPPQEPPDGPSDCLQAGPILVRDGQRAWQPETSGQRQLWTSRQAQAIVCLVGDSAKLVATDPLPLTDLVPVLSDENGPLSCTNALRLTGSRTVELYVKGLGPFTSQQTLLPNALVVVPR
jgi:hypothetical protein